MRPPFPLPPEQAARVLAKALILMRQAEVGWDESKHPRVPGGSDAGGEFTDGGDTGTGLMRSPGSGRGKGHGKSTPTYDSGEFQASPSDAVESLAQGKPVAIAHEDLRNLIDKSADYTKNVDLSLLTIDDTPVFAGGLNMDRKMMPQIPDDHRDAFIAWAKDQGVKITFENAAPMSLRATQSGILAQRVEKKLVAFEAGKRDATPIFVSGHTDNFVIDGHHRWAMSVALWSQGAKVQQPVIRMHVPIKTALGLMKHYMSLNHLHTRGLANILRLVALRLKVLEDRDPRASAYYTPRWAERTASGYLVVDLRTGLTMRLAYDPNQTRAPAGSGVESGRWVKDDAGGGAAEAVAPVGQVEREVKSGVGAVGGLIPAVVAQVNEARHDAQVAPGMNDDSISRFSELDAVSQDKAEADFKDNALQGITVDDTGIIEDFKYELRMDPSDLISNASSDARAELAGKFDKDVDWATLQQAIDKGDAAGNHYVLDPKGLDAVRFEDGSMLTQEQKDKVDQVWSGYYQDAFVNAVDQYRESDTYYEKRNALEADKVNDLWNALSNTEKLQAAQNAGVTMHQPGVPEPPPPPVSAPGQWIIQPPPEGAALGVQENYQRTVAISGALVNMRAEQVMKDRGIGFQPGAADRMGTQMWNDWQRDPTGDSVKATQLAVAQELGGEHGFSASEVRRLSDQFDIPARQAYIRGQWETSQFLLQKAGAKDAVDVYRAVMVPTPIVNAAGQDHQFAGEPRLTGLVLPKQGAISTTMDLAMANTYMDPTAGPNTERVVLRFHVPRSSVLSLPIYGHGTDAQREVVLTGKNLKWDAWRSFAPEPRNIPVPETGGG